MVTCQYHLCENELTGKQRKFCSKTCCVKTKIRRWRHQTKLRAIEYKGGACEQCGFVGCPAVFDFHHRDPSQKDFGIAASGNCVAWEKVQAELDKCDMLCANCHRTLHFEEKEREVQHLSQTSR